MEKARLRAPASGGTADEVEAEFYEALAAGDLERLMACWAEDEDDIVCVHPGGARLVGAAAIRASFETLFDNGGVIRATPQHVRRIDSAAGSMHNLIERIDVATGAGPRHGYVVATNVYQRTSHGWRMVAHHASPGTMTLEEPDEQQQLQQQQQRRSARTLH